jgi:inosine/xanthosine triphosphatase
MQKVAVASKNPVKLNAVKEGFKLLFPNTEFSFEAIAAPSGVADQPMTDDETYTGALNRVNHLASSIEADYWIAIEGGAQEKNDEYEVFAWVIVKSKEGKMGKGRSATFFLPPPITKLMREGKELAHASDIVFNESQSGQKQGTIGILTNNVIDRTRYYIDPVIMALVPFKNPTLY